MYELLLTIAIVATAVCAGALTTFLIVRAVYRKPLVVQIQRLTESLASDRDELDKLFESVRKHAQVIQGYTTPDDVRVEQLMGFSKELRDIRNFYETRRLERVSELSAISEMANPSVRETLEALKKQVSESSGKVTDSIDQLMSSIQTTVDAMRRGGGVGPQV
jgi:uncharacterized coiled-coil DUF342 family protein